MNLFRLKVKELYELLFEAQDKIKLVSIIRIKYVGIDEFIYNKAKEDYNLLKNNIYRIKKEIKCRLKI